MRLAQAGDFRRPLTQTFNPITARQVIAAETAAMVFSSPARPPFGGAAATP